MNSSTKSATTTVQLHKAMTVIFGFFAAFGWARLPHPWDSSLSSWRCYSDLLVQVLVQSSQKEIG